MNKTTDPNAVVFGPMDHYDAADAATVLASTSPAIRNFFMPTGTITPGVQATVALHKDQGFQDLHEYIQARVAAGATGRIVGWCK